MEKVKQNEVEENQDQNETLFPISEIFTNYQGEGVYAGTLMTFIRFAGCNVGKPYPKEKYEVGFEQGKQHPSIPAELPIYTEKCTTYDGREFACDTDYRVKQRLAYHEIVGCIPNGVKHVCITGGEPFMHKFMPLFIERLAKLWQVHVETSGTKPVPDLNAWITLSPKQGVRYDAFANADELKLLVDENFDPTKKISLENPFNDKPMEIELWYLAQSVITYLQPINNEHTICAENLKLCLKWQEKFPQFRVCLQLHKAIGAIIGRIER